MFASSVTAGFLVLVFKRSIDPIRIVVGRCGIALLGGIFLTKPTIHYFGLHAAADNAITLGGIASACSAAMFLVGFALLRLINRSSDRIASKIIDKWFPGLLDEEDEKRSKKP